MHDRKLNKYKAIYIYNQVSNISQKIIVGKQQMSYYSTAFFG